MFDGPIARIAAWFPRVAFIARRTSGDSPADDHWIHDWVNVRAIQAIAHHTSTVVVAVVLFWLVGLAVQYLLHDGTIKNCVLWFDEFILLCLFVFFAYELFLYL
ncbi:MAG: hypothetical protein ACREQN_15005 [Candidatus Binataceae bacterium]